MKNNSYIVKGFLREVQPVKNIKTVTVREFIVDTEEDYPQPLSFELFKEKTSLVDGLPVGQALNVHFSQRGREYNGRYFVSNRAWKIEVVAGGKAVPAPKSVSEEATAPAAAQPVTEEKPF